MKPRRVLPALLLLLHALPSQAQEFPLPELPPAAPRAAEFRVDRISFRGNTVLSTAELQAIAAPYVGRRVGVDELETLRQALTRAYTERGYVNSGLLLPAKLADGPLEFEVMEGRLSSLRLRGMGRLDERYLSARLMRPEEPVLNIERLRERFALLLNDPLFERINARLEPGAAAGEAILDVEVQRARPWQLSVFANNYRPVSIGAEAAGIAASVRNLSGQGDLLDVKLQAPLRKGESGGHGGQGSLGWQLPLGWMGWTDGLFSAALESGNSSVIEEPVKLLDIRSKLESRDVGLSHRVFEDLSQSLSIGLNHARRENRTTLLGEPFSFTPGVPDGETRETLWRFWQSYAWRSEKQVLALRSSFTRGRSNVQEIVGLPPGPAPARTFHLWTGQAHYAYQVMDNGAQLIGRLTVQATHDRLLALDGLTLGGVSTVRGYRENLLVRDRGAYLRLEFEYPLVKTVSISTMALTLTPFFDHGRVRNLGEPAASLSSLGLALRMSWAGLQLDLAAAKRLKHPTGTAPIGDSLQDHGLHLQLAYKF